MQSDLFVRWENGTAARIHHRAVKVMNAYEIRALDTIKSWTSCFLVNEPTWSGR